jgi:hypothetical protein
MYASAPYSGVSINSDLRDLKFWKHLCDVIFFQLTANRIFNSCARLCNFFSFFGGAGAVGCVCVRGGGGGGDAI